MSKGFSLLKIKSAVTGRSTSDLSYSHLYSTDFGRILPLGVIDCVPSDKYKVQMSLFNRMAPLAVPSYGHATVRNVAMWVPFHMVAQDVESYIAGSKYYNGDIATSRYFTADTLAQYLINKCSATVPSTSYYDFVYHEANGTTVYKVLNSHGKYFVQILNSLGYAIPQGIDFRTSSPFKTKPMKFSAIRLLSFVKAYNDWFSQSARYNTSQVTSVLQAIKLKNSTQYVSAAGEITYQSFLVLFDSFPIMYDTDYFTGAWQAPGELVDGDVYNEDSMSPNIGINALSSNDLGGIGSIGTNQTDVVASPTGAELKESQYQHYNVQKTLSAKALDLVFKFDKWLRRNNYSGNRFTEKLKSRFGIDIEDKRNEFAVILGKSESPLQIGDITASVDGQTSDGAYYPLGEYGGKGIINDKLSFEHKAQDFGTIIVLSYITVHPFIGWQGVDRENLKVISPSDWYQPEYDGGIPAPIAFAELAEVSDETTAQHDGADVFGFTERYSEYVCPLHDRITGDFRRYNDMHSWHFGRDMSTLRQARYTAQNTNIVAMHDAEQYDRIFTIEDDADHFYCTAFFDIRATRPMKSLSSKVDLGDGDNVISRNGNQMS